MTILNTVVNQDSMLKRLSKMILIPNEHTTSFLSSDPPLGLRMEGAML
jgi:hypothetical protein